MAASYLAAPRFTAEDEVEERASMTVEEKLAALADLYGNVPVPRSEVLGALDPSDRNDAAADDSGAALPPLPSPWIEETEDLLETSLEKLDRALDEASESGRSDGGDGDGGGENGAHRFGNGRGCGGLGGPGASASADEAYRRATRLCPEIVLSRKHRLLFLRAEYFDAKRAAARLLAYWNGRVDLFGEEYAFGPLTVDSGAFDADMKELAMGYPRLSPLKDESSRAIIAINHSGVKRNTFNRRGMMRACWLVMHRAIEDVIVQQRGIIFLGLGYGQLDQIDRKLDATIWRCIRDVLPCRLVSSQVVVASMSADLIMPNVKFILGRHSRARLREYSGNDPRFLEKLAALGIGAEGLPSEIGGGWVYDKRWFEKL
mmetsp:Transcript_63133/g.186563  ORF Transcript_63133/g.186563 Transcript_63133/m.186563 type:complete len:374 (-) Transcript_63133:611-1732(-)